MMQSVWAVTYYDIGDDPVVTIFDNKPAALKWYECLLGKHDRVNIDETPVYKFCNSVEEIKETLF